MKFAVSNLDISLAWYERVLGARRIPSLDHISKTGVRFAAVCQMDDWSGLLLELRQTPVQASKERGWDPVTLSVKGRKELEAWIEWLEGWGTVHSPLMVGVRGWLVVFEVGPAGNPAFGLGTDAVNQDPDGRRIRMYTKEDHGGTIPASRDEYWLREI